MDRFEQVLMCSNRVNQGVGVRVGTEKDPSRKTEKEDRRKNNEWVFCYIFIISIII